MDELSPCGRFFEARARRWIAADGSVAGHLRRVERVGLAAEFRSDPHIEELRAYVHRISDVAYVQDSTYANLRAQVRRAMNGPGTRVTRRDLDMIVSVTFEVCGIDPLGNRLVRIVGNLPR